MSVLGSGFRPFDEMLCRNGDSQSNGTWVSSREVRCVSLEADSVACASGSAFLRFYDHEEAMQLCAIHTLGPRGQTVKNGALILTYAETLQERSVVLRGPRMCAEQHFAATWELYIGSGLGGEGVSACLGDLPDAPFGEQCAGDGLRVLFLTHAERLEVYYDGELLVGRYVARGVFRAGRFVRVRIAYDATGLHVLVSGVVLVQDLVISAWSARPTWRFGIGARTGEGRTDEHRIDNLLLVVGGRLTHVRRGLRWRRTVSSSHAAMCLLCTTRRKPCRAFRRSAVRSSVRRRWR